MTAQQLLRFSGFVVVVGGIVSIVQLLFTAVAYVSTDPTPYARSSVWITAQLVGVVATLVRTRRRTG